jgi:hypothetical protein
MLDRGPIGGFSGATAMMVEQAQRFAYFQEIAEGIGSK